MSDFDPTLDETPARRFDPVLIRRLTGFLRPYRWNAIGLFSLVALVALFEAMLPQLMRLVIDRVIVGGNHGELGLYAAAYGVLVLVMALCIWCFIVLGGKVSSHVSHDIRRAGFAHLQRLSFSFFDHRPVGWLMARMTSDCDRLARFMAWGVLDIVFSLALMTIFGAIMLWMDWRLGLLTLSVVPPLAIVSAFYQQRILKSSRAMRRFNSRLTASFSEGIAGVNTSKILNREEANQREFAELSGLMRSSAVRTATLSAQYFPIVLGLGSIGAALALYFGGEAVLESRLSLGTMIVFVTYAREFFAPIHEMARVFAEWQQAQASAERIMGLIDTPPAIDDSPEVRAALAAQAGHPQADLAPDGRPDRIGTIRFENVSFHYVEGEPVLRDFDLEVAPGERIALVGPTGGGKSTIASLLCRFYEPTAGRLLVDGIDYRRRSLHWWQSRIGIVLQAPHIFSGTISENIRYGRLEATPGEIIEAARLAGAWDFIHSLPQGLGTRVGERGETLSVGQRQLVSLARAILSDPAVFIMDEATASVDTRTEQVIQQGIERILDGRTSFVIAHRLSTIRNADRILFIEAGRIVEAGSHHDLILARGRYYRLYSRQFSHEHEQRVIGGENATGSPAPA